MTKIYLIRHAQSEANLSGVYGSDAPLSSEGIRQAEEAHRTMNIRPNHVITGTNTRQIQTAQIMFPNVYKHQTSPIFDEIDFGDLESLPITQEQNKEITENTLSLKYEHGGDDIWKRAKRAVEYMTDVCGPMLYPKIAIISGDTLIQAIVCLLLYGEKDNYIWSTKSHVRNCECITIEINTNAVDKYNNKRCIIDRLYINGENKLTVPAWEAKNDGFRLV